MGGHDLNLATSWRRPVRGHAALLLFVVCVALVGLILRRGVALEMHKTAHARLTLYAIPAVISWRYHGAAGYSEYTKVQDLLFESEPSALNDAIAQAINLRLAPDAETQVFPADDKGTVDLVSLAFLLFGPTVEGIFYTTVLLLLTTVVLYCAYFRDRPDRCVVPVFVLGALYAAMPAFVLTRELHSLTNPRLIEIIALIPLFHLLFALYDRDRFSWTRLALLAPQVFFVVEAVHIRSTAAWLVICVLTLYLVLFAYRVLAPLRRRWALDPAGAAVLRSGWVVGLLLAGLLGLKAYQRQVYDGRYFATHIPHRIFWHNVGIGLALHPRLAATYALDVADVPMVNLVRQRLAGRGDEERIEETFGRPNRHAIASNFVAYEAEAKAAVLDILKSHPRAAVELFLYYKPRAGLRTLAWAHGVYPFGLRKLYLSDQASSLATPEDRAGRSLHVQWLSPVLAVALIFCCLIHLPHPRSMLVLTAVALFVVLCSLIPAALTYPLLHVLGAALVTTTLFFLCLVVTGVAAGVRLLRPSLGTDGEDCRGARSEDGGQDPALPGTR
jgi:hypothetical protein